MTENRSIMDEVLVKMEEMMASVSKKAEVFRGDMPFNTRRKTVDERLMEYQGLTPQAIQAMVERDGEIETFKNLKHMRGLRDRRQGNAE